MIIDSHAHLSDERLLPRVDEIVDGWDGEGIESVFEVGYSLESSRKAVELSQKYDSIYAIVGVHPHDAKTYDEECDRLFTQWAAQAKTLAVGEIGLDYYYDLSPRDVQRDVFARQIELADRLSLPIVLHIRDAYGDAYDMLSAYRARLNHGVLIHCYSSSAQMLKQFDKFDCYYSLGGAITFKNAKKEEVIQAIRDDRLLVETDSPYMTPVPYRGRPNEPKYINYVVDKIAEVKGVDRQSVIDMTYANTKRLFFKYDR